MRPSWLPKILDSPVHISFALWEVSSPYPYRKHPQIASAASSTIIQHTVLFLQIIDHPASDPMCSTFRKRYAEELRHLDTFFKPTPKTPILPKESTPVASYHPTPAEHHNLSPPTATPPQLQRPQHLQSTPTTRSTTSESEKTKLWFPFFHPTSVH